MIILAFHFGHDAAVAVADEYRVLAAVQAERLTRNKGEGSFASVRDETIDEALRVAGKSRADVDVVVFGRAIFDFRMYRKLPATLHWKCLAARLLGREKMVSLWQFYRKTGRIDCAAALRLDALAAALGFRADVRFFDYGHHAGHALSALFYTDWDDALLYTADGGGDWLYYSARHLHGGRLDVLYGGDEEMRVPRLPVHSVGRAYGYMTQALGYRMNRHEGKLTGLAAFGTPTVYAELARHFWVREDGVIESDFKRLRDMDAVVSALGRSAAPADAAASVQKLLEELVLESLRVYLRRTGAVRVGLAGGVFANVALNRRVAELSEVDEVFVFPAMADDGAAVGGIFEFLLRRDGMATWLGARRRLTDVYWGGAFDREAAAVFEAAVDVTRVEGEAADAAARLLAEGNIVAIFCGRMEFGPRALGARSILASPADKGVNDSLNARLSRTEFMPFAPYVLEEDVARVFDAPAASRYAMRFMTITCDVREEWRERIGAVVHVDGSARPQVVRDEDNSLYAGILRRFRDLTGLPVLVNTSFNAHEEPIVCRPEECLRALRDGRVDYVVLEAGVFGLRREE